MGGLTTPQAPPLCAMVPWQSTAVSLVISPVVETAGLVLVGQTGLELHQPALVKPL